MFSLLKKLGEVICFQCNEKIENSDSLSIEHKIPYLDSDDPKKLFFDLDNISFSHLTCNVSARRTTTVLAHPSINSYNRGCRCEDCRKIGTETKRKYRENKKYKI